MILLGACPDELVVKLYHSEQAVSLLVSKLELEIDGLSGVYWADGHSKPPEADVIGHDEAPLPAESELVGGEDGLGARQHV